MRESKVLNKRREIISELKELIEQYKYGDKMYRTLAEKVDLSKYKKVIKAITRKVKIIEYTNQKSNITHYKTRR